MKGAKKEKSLYNEIRLIPAVSRVLVEYESMYGEEDARKAWEHLVKAIVKKVEARNEKH